MSRSIEVHIQKLLSKTKLSHSDQQTLKHLKKRLSLRRLLYDLNAANKKSIDKK